MFYIAKENIKNTKVKKNDIFKSLKNPCVIEPVCYDCKGMIKGCCINTLLNKKLIKPLNIIKKYKKDDINE